MSALIQTVALAQTTGPTVAASRDGDNPQTIVAGRPDGEAVVSGWFVAPTFGTTGWGGTLAYTPGLRGGVYLDRRLAIGLAINVLANGDSHLGKDEGRNFGTYGGVLLQYVVHSNRLVHVSFESTIGDGHWCASNESQRLRREEIHRLRADRQPRAERRASRSIHDRRRLSLRRGGQRRRTF